MTCFHRPGRMRGAIVTCRYCGVAIEYCPCTGDHWRRVDPDCPGCGGSMWVAIVRGWRAKLADLTGIFEKRK